MVDIGTINIPEIQKQYAKLKDELEFIDHKRVVSKAELDNINNQISILRRTVYQLSATCNNKGNAQYVNSFPKMIAINYQC
jgi:hypothetical protein